LPVPQARCSSNAVSACRTADNVDALAAVPRLDIEVAALASCLFHINLC
jgi:hypothetical protein